jgi:hypothetical protein
LNLGFVHLPPGEAKQSMPPIAMSRAHAEIKKRIRVLDAIAVIEVSIMRLPILRTRLDDPLQR